jgi:hypothetical protein
MPWESRRARDSCIVVGGNGKDTCPVDVGGVEELPVGS